MRRETGRGARRLGAVLAAVALLGGLAVLGAPGGAGADVTDRVGNPAVRKLTLGDIHGCAIVDDGAVKCWGNNSAGQLGLGDTTDRPANPPAVDLGTGRTAVAISAGAGHTCAVLDDGSVKCWGLNAQGQLGLGDLEDRGDEPGEMGDALPAVDLGTGRTAVAVGAELSMTCVVLDDGSVKCWGENNNGQLGVGDNADRGDEPGEMGDALPAVDLGTGRTAVAVAGGQRTACALLDDASVKCWGANNLGELGQGDTVRRGDDPGELGDALPPIDLGTGRTALAIAPSQRGTCALLDDGSVKCWGDNEQGELGQGDVAGRGNEPGEMGDALSPVDLGTGRTATTLAKANFSVCAVLDDGTVKCWGGNSSGRLGLGDAENRGDQPGEMGDALPPVSLGTGRTALGVVMGASDTCAVLDDGSIKCWGVNVGDEPGEMGDNLPVVELGTGLGDLIAPGVSITTPEAGAVFVRDQAVTVDYGCSDDGGLASCTGDLPHGEVLDTTTPGQYRFAVTAVDNEGNPTTAVHRYSVIDPTCLGREATVVLVNGDQPTAGPDVIYGTSGPDTINALGGDDIVCGRGGDDVVQGGPGRDSLYGGNGADTLRAGAISGGGVLGGNAGDDVLIGSAGNDTLRGGPDDDTITGRAGNDLANGGPGTDTCRLTPGADTRTACEA